MSTASLKTVFGGGNFFPTLFSGTLNVAAGVSGAIVTITPPDGKKVRLYGLLPTGSPPVSEPGISIITSFGTVVNSLSLTNSASNIVGSFNVGFNTSIGGFTDSSMSIPYIESEGALTISKGGGVTANILTYSYAFGD